LSASSSGLTTALSSSFDVSRATVTGSITLITKFMTALPPHYRLPCAERRAGRRRCQPERRHCQLRQQIGRHRQDRHCHRPDAQRRRRRQLSTGFHQRQHDGGISRPAH
jgi:hypothetical protein